MSKSRRPAWKRESAIAAAVTFTLALAILLLLFFMELHTGRQALAEASTPEIQDEEPVFLEPEFIPTEQQGDEESADIDQAAPPLQGKPDVAEKPVETAKPKPVQKAEATPAPTEEEKRAAKKMEENFKKSAVNGNAGTQTAFSGSGAGGVGFSGNIGRKLISANTWPVNVTHKQVKVGVSITVDAEGNVTKATAVSGGTPALRRECEKMARGFKWNKEPGAKPATGTINFTITR